MRVFVTGANAFIGRHVVSQLARAGFEVIASYRTADARLDALRAFDNVTLAPLDVSQAAEFSRFPGRIDAIVHIAAVSQAAGISLDALLACNVMGTKNVIDYGLSAGARRIVFASSLSVYGRIEVDAVEPDTPVRDPDVYGASKLLGERMFAAAADVLPCVAVRLPGVLGPGAHRAVLPTLLEKIRAGTPISIYNPNSPFNNAAHVDDLGSLFIQLVRCDLSGYDPITVGAAGMTTMATAVERLMAGAGRRVPVSIAAAPKSGFVISSQRAIERYGYRPMDIEPMIDKYVAESIASGPA